MTEKNIKSKTWKFAKRNAKSEKNWEAQCEATFVLLSALIYFNFIISATHPLQLLSNFIISATHSLQFISKISTSATHSLQLLSTLSSLQPTRFNFTQKLAFLQPTPFNYFQLYHPCNPLGSISLKISNSQLQTFKFVILLFLHENTINSPTPKNPFLTIFDYKTETP